MTNADLSSEFTILALETSCDETAAAIVRGGQEIIANVVASQVDEHRRFGGIVPEVASRQHILALTPVIEEALARLPGGWAAVDAVAATYGPGLSGALLTGLNAAKAIAWARNLPFVGVNHLEAHIYANWLIPERPPTTDHRPPTADKGKDRERGRGGEEEKRREAHAVSPPPPLSPSPPLQEPPRFPLVALVVSGGHTLLALLEGHGCYRLLGQTRDDAAGEAFDKVARIMGLGFPGGPAIQQVAMRSQGGLTLPRAWLRDSYDFSFSGLKTAVLHEVQGRQAREAKVAPDDRRRRKNQEPERIRENQEPERIRENQEPGGPALRGGPPKNQELRTTDNGPLITDKYIAQLAHAFQESVVDVLVTKTVEAARAFGATEILLAGGVAANIRLREELTRRAEVPVRYPPLPLCTDNAAMIGAAAYYRFESGRQSGWDLDVEPNLKLA